MILGPRSPGLRDLVVTYFCALLGELGTWLLDLRHLAENVTSVSDVSTGVTTSVTIQELL